MGLAALLSAGGAVLALGDKQADAELGQDDFSGTDCNQSALGPASLCKPRALSVSPFDGRLFVADTNNNRVLSWPSAASFTSGQAADLVLGQASFTVNSAGSSASKLNRPGGVAADGQGNVWVSDSLNHRVLRFNAPLSSGMAASKVIGQTSLSNHLCNQPSGFDATASNLCTPNQIAFKLGKLYVADGQNERVLRFSGPFSNGMAADLVLGQASFTTLSCGLSASGLCSPQSVVVDAGGAIYVSDAQNQRVLRYSGALSNGMAADLVLGQPDFTTGGASCAPASAATLCDAVGLWPDAQGRLWVADYRNNRLLRFAPPLSNGQAASFVLGQADFTSNAPNRGQSAASENRLNSPAAVLLREGHLYLADHGNSRLTRYD